MIKRLTRRIVLGCVEARPTMCRYMAMRETMRCTSSMQPFSIQQVKSNGDDA